MQATDLSTISTEALDSLAEAAIRAGEWAGEPLLRPDEDPAAELAPGTARRRALDEALTEIEAGRRAPSPRWKVRFALMLGLERVLSEEPARTAAGTELRRHQVDALAGMLTELISAHEEEANGNGHVEVVDEEEEEDEDELGLLQREPEEEVAFKGADPGAIRRFRFRHPTASGKTIAAAGFVE